MKFIQKLTNSRIIRLALVVALLCGLTSSVRAADDTPRVVVVIANYLSLDDLASSGPHVRGLISNGAIALVNTGKAGVSPDAQCLTIGAGTRVALSSSDALCLNSSEKFRNESAGDRYTRQTGERASGDSVVCLGLAQILSLNRKPVSKTPAIGYLGDAFHKAGLRTAVVGNSDTPDDPNRLAAFVAMDSNGIVDSGSVGSSVLKMNPDSPCGWEDDPDKLASLASDYMENHALVVLELGDLSRLEEIRPILEESALKHYRAQGIRKLDILVGKILPEIERTGATLIICSPSRARREGYWSNLAPVIVYKPGEVSGFLTSSSTRAKGLISNVDLGPTILNAAGINVPDIILGRPAEIVPASFAVPDLQRMERVASRNYAIRIPVLSIIAAIIILSVTLSELAVRRIGRFDRARRIYRLGFLFIFAVPLSLLLVDGMEASGFSEYSLKLMIVIASIITASCIISDLLSKLSRGRLRSPLAVITIITAMVLAADVLMGARMIRSSIVTCDHIVGIRYYGLGNEYMGILIGMSLLGPALLLRSWSISRGGAVNSVRNVNLSVLVLLFMWFVGIACVIGYPGLGANVGGLVTAIAAFGVALIVMHGNQFRAREVGLLAAVTGGVVVIFAVVDVFTSGGHVSHLGRSILQARIYGWESLWALVSGKVSMHLGILRLPQAYLPMLFGAPVLMMYGKRANSEDEQARRLDIFYRVATPASIAGMVAAFLFNDSGIVPAAVLLSMFIASVLYLRLEEAE